MIWLVLLLTLIYIGYVVGPMYYRYQMMVFEVKGEIKVAHMYDENEIFENLTLKVNEWNLPIDEDNIRVDRRDEDVIIHMSYHIDKLFLTFYKRRFNFVIREKGVIKTDSY